jgi:site-specific recombinase XerD
VIDKPILRKMFKVKPITSWEIIDKKAVDEIIFRTDKLRGRIIMELMARGGMRVAEVLKLRPMDVHERKLTLRDPKSGKERCRITRPCGGYRTFMYNLIGMRRLPGKSPRFVSFL